MPRRTTRLLAEMDQFFKREPYVRQGVCIDCHKAPPAEGHHRCDPCYDIEKERVKAENRARWQRRAEERGKQAARAALRAERKAEKERLQKEKMEARRKAAQEREDY